MPFAIRLNGSGLCPTFGSVDRLVAADTTQGSILLLMGKVSAGMHLASLGEDSLPAFGVRSSGSFGGDSVITLIISGGAIANDQDC